MDNKYVGLLYVSEVIELFTQGLLSTTFLVDIFFKEDGGEEEKKCVFVKVPLTGEASKNFKQVKCEILSFIFYLLFCKKVNVREFEMYTNVLPELQKYLADHCEGIVQYKKRVELFGVSKVN